MGSFKVRGAVFWELEAAGFSVFTAKAEEVRSGRLFLVVVIGILASVVLTGSGLSLSVVVGRFKVVRSRFMVEVSNRLSVVWGALEED